MARASTLAHLLAQRAADYGCFVAFCNAVGGQDELVFDGHSLVLDPTGAVVAFAFLFAAFAYTQFDMVGVTDQEELEGAEGARRARDALARKRGYFRK